MHPSHAHAHYARLPPRAAARLGGGAAAATHPGTVVGGHPPARRHVHVAPPAAASPIYAHPAAPQAASPLGGGATQAGAAASPLPPSAGGPQGNKAPPSPAVLLVTGALLTLLLIMLAILGVYALQQRARSAKALASLPSTPAATGTSPTARGEAAARPPLPPRASPTATPAPRPTGPDFLAYTRVLTQNVRVQSMLAARAAQPPPRHPLPRPTAADEGLLPLLADEEGLALLNGEEGDAVIYVENHHPCPACIVAWPHVREAAAAAARASDAVRGVLWARVDDSLGLRTALMAQVTTTPLAIVVRAPRAVGGVLAWSYLELSDLVVPATTLRKVRAALGLREAPTLPAAAAEPAALAAADAPAHAPAHAAADALVAAPSGPRDVLSASANGNAAEVTPAAPSLAAPEPREPLPAGGQDAGSPSLDQTAPGVPRRSATGAPSSATSRRRVHRGDATPGAGR